MAFSLNPHNHCEIQVLFLYFMDKKTKDLKRQSELAQGYITSREQQSWDLNPYLSAWRCLHFNCSAIWSLCEGSAEGKLSPPKASVTAICIAEHWIISQCCLASGPVLSFHVAGWGAVPYCERAQLLECIWKTDCGSLLGLFSCI